MLTFVEGGFGWGLVAVVSIIGLFLTPFKSGLEWGYVAGIIVAGLGGLVLRLSRENPRET